MGLYIGRKYTALAAIEPLYALGRERVNSPMQYRA